MPEATVIVPTYEHGPTLRHAVGSALRQTISDIEVIVVGDGVTERTREAIEELLRADERVRFLDRPKAPGHGFVHRHEAVEGAASERILYLSDDDLWFPEHVAVMSDLLEDADFAVGLGISIGPEGLKFKHPTDLSLPHYQDLVRSRATVFQHSAIVNTRMSYRQLTHVWLVSEKDSTYKAFWTQFFEASWRTASARLPTVLQFTSPPRAGMSLDERAAELASWEGALQRSTERLALMEHMLAVELRRNAELTSEVASIKARRVEQKRRAIDRKVARRKLPRTNRRARKQRLAPEAQAGPAGSGSPRERGRSPAEESGGWETSRSDSTGPSGGSGQSSDSAGSSKRTPNSSAGSQ
jgi:GalNAc5-diNAcBac-PP-undecaprenol beta-1,3-glucosyltransferase